MDDAKVIECLIVDDDEDDYIIATDTLNSIESQEHAIYWAADYDTATDILQEESLDICLVDYRIGVRTGIDFIRDSVKAGCRVPMILLTGLGNRELDLEATTVGAFDFMVKDNLDPEILERSIRFAIARSEQLNALEDRTALLTAVLEHTGAGIAAFDRDQRLETYNERLIEILGINAVEVAQIEQNEDEAAALKFLGDAFIERMRLFEPAAAMQRDVELSEGRIVDVRHNLAPGGRHVFVCMDTSEKVAAEPSLIFSNPVDHAGSLA